MSNIEGIELKSGDTLNNPIDCAVEVSEWLSASHPNTKPKTPNELVVQGSDSLYAMQGSSPVGHIAAHLQPELFTANMVTPGSRGGFVDIDLDLAHFTIASLVVKPGKERQGIGTLLLTTVMEATLLHPASSLKDVGLAYKAAVLSALACEASMPLFGKLGFKDPEDEGTFGFGTALKGLSGVEPYASMDMAANATLGKSVVGKGIIAKDKSNPTTSHNLRYPYF